MPGILQELADDRAYALILEDPAIAPVRHLFENERSRWTRFFFGQPGVPHVVLA